MHNPLTKEDLEQLGELIEKDRACIEKAIEYLVGGPVASSEDDLRIRCLRGFLAEQFLDCIPDDNLREEIGADAAAFCDGWNYCLKYGGS